MAKNSILRSAKDVIKAREQVVEGHEGDINQEDVEAEIKKLKEEIQSYYLEHPEQDPSLPDKIFVRDMNELEEKLTEHIPKKVVEDEIIVKNVIEQDGVIGGNADGPNPLDFSRMREFDLPDDYLNELFLPNEKAVDEEQEMKKYVVGDDSGSGTGGGNGKEAAKKSDRSRELKERDELQKMLLMGLEGNETEENSTGGEDSTAMLENSEERTSQITEEDSIVQELFGDGLFMPDNNSEEDTLVNQIYAGSSFESGGQGASKAEGGEGPGKPGKTGGEEKTAQKSENKHKSKVREEDVQDILKELFYEGKLKEDVHMDDSGAVGHEDTQGQGADERGRGKGDGAEDKSAEAEKTVGNDEISKEELGKLLKDALENEENQKQDDQEADLINSIFVAGTGNKGNENNENMPPRHSSHNKKEKIDKNARPKAVKEVKEKIELKKYESNEEEQEENVKEVKVPVWKNKTEKSGKKTTEDNAKEAPKEQHIGNKDNNAGQTKSKNKSIPNNKGGDSVSSHSGSSDSQGGSGNTEEENRAKFGRGQEDQEQRSDQKVDKAGGNNVVAADERASGGNSGNNDSNSGGSRISNNDPNVSGDIEASNSGITQAGSGRAGDISNRSGREASSENQGNSGQNESGIQAGSSVGIENGSADNTAVVASKGMEAAKESGKNIEDELKGLLDDRNKKPDVSDEQKVPQVLQEEEIISKEANIVLENKTDAPENEEIPQVGLDEEFLRDLFGQLEDDEKAEEDQPEEAQKDNAEEKPVDNQAAKGDSLLDDSEEEKADFSNQDQALDSRKDVKGEQAAEMGLNPEDTLHITEGEEGNQGISLDDITEKELVVEKEQIAVPIAVPQAPEIIEKEIIKQEKVVAEEKVQIPVKVPAKSAEVDAVGLELNKGEKAKPVVEVNSDETMVSGLISGDKKQETIPLEDVKQLEKSGNPLLKAEGEAAAKAEQLSEEDEIRAILEGTAEKPREEADKKPKEEPDKQPGIKAAKEGREKQAQGAKAETRPRKKKPRPDKGKPDEENELDKLFGNIKDDKNAEDDIMKMLDGQQMKQAEPSAEDKGPAVNLQIEGSQSKKRGRKRKKADQKREIVRNNQSDNKTAVPAVKNSKDTGKPKAEVTVYRKEEKKSFLAGLMEKLREMFKPKEKKSKTPSAPKMDVVNPHSREEIVPDERADMESQIQVDGVISGSVQGENIIVNPYAIVKQDVEATGQVVCMDSATIMGCVKGDTIIVEGIIRGDVYGNEQVIVKDGGLVAGNIYGKKVHVDGQSILHGSIYHETEDIEKGSVISG